jgi:hypothetical protein
MTALLIGRYAGINVAVYRVTINIGEERTFYSGLIERLHCLVNRWKFS